MVTGGLCTLDLTHGLWVSMSTNIVLLLVIWVNMHACIKNSKTIKTAVGRKQTTSEYCLYLCSCNKQTEILFRDGDRFPSLGRMLTSDGKALDSTPNITNSPDNNK